MLVALIYALMLHQVDCACDVQDICTEKAAVQAEIADQHNAFRRAVQPTASDMLKMSYDETLAASAQAWVNKCILAHGSPSTRMLNGYELGENLFYASEPYSWTTIITSWHDEVTRFVYPDRSRNGQSIGHYTQVVWNSSYRVGCGVAQCPGNIYLYGCHYYRAGNFKGWIPYKIGPPCASCPDSCEDKLCTNPCPHINKFLNCPNLKKTLGCSNKLVYTWCPAACKCTNEIIPIYRR